MLFRRIAVTAALATAVVLPAASTAAAADPGRASASHQSTFKKPSAKTKFAAAGTVTAIDATAGTMTIKVKGGTKDVRRKTVTVAVPAGAKVVVNGAAGTLAGIVAGYGVSLTGTRSGTAYTAAKVVARGKKAHPVPSPSVSPPDDDNGDDLGDDHGHGHTTEPSEPAETPAA